MKAASQHLDNETMRALVCAMTAATLGLAMDARPLQTAALTAISMTGNAVCNTRWVKPKIDEWQTQNPSINVQWVINLIFAEVLINVAGQAGFPINNASNIAVLVGTIGGNILWSKTSSQKLEYQDEAHRKLPALAYPLLGAAIGAVRPQLFSPLHGALLMGLIQAQSLSSKHARYEGRNTSWYPAIQFFKVAAFVATPLIADQMGFATSWKQFAIAAVATEVVPAAMGIYESYKGKQLANK